jgi:DNA polymerase-3 subunit beta
MKIEFNRKQLLTAIGEAAAATPSRTPKDILKSVLLTGHGMHFEVIGTDQEIGIRVAIPADAVISNESPNQSVETLLPPQRIRQILTELSDVNVTIDIEDKNIRVISSNAKFRVTTEDPKEFPPVPEPGTENCYQVPAYALAAAIRRTEFACDVESTRYALGGINVEVKDGKLIMAATDSRRLSVVGVACETIGNPAEVTKATVVPLKAWKAVASACGSGAESCRFVIDEHSISLSVGNVAVYSRLVEGRFPKYRDVIPKRSNATVSLPCGPFYAAVKQSQICLDSETRAVQMTFHDGVVHIDSSSSGGESAVEFPCEYDYEKITLSLDPKYIADVLRVMPAEHVLKCAMNTADDAVLFQDDGDFRYVVMPLQR